MMSFVGGVLSGAVVGAVAVLMLTPTSGNELRTNIQLHAEELLTDFRAAVDRERERLEEELAALQNGDLQLN
jgi:gas vesicle protein